MKKQQAELTPWEQEQLDRAIVYVEMEDAYTREIRRMEERITQCVRVIVYATVITIGALSLWLVSI